MRMGRIGSALCVTGVVLLSAGCGQSIKNAIEAKVPELRRLDVGSYDMGFFKAGQATPFRILPLVSNEPRTITFTTIPESRRFDVVLDDGRIFRFDDENDIAELAGTHLGRQSFYIEFRQDMRMIVVVSPPSHPVRTGVR